MSYHLIILQVASFRRSMKSLLPCEDKMKQVEVKGTLISLSQCLFSKSLIVVISNRKMLRKKYIALEKKYFFIGMYVFLLFW